MSGRYAYIEGQLITLNNDRPEMALAVRDSLPRDSGQDVADRDAELTSMVAKANSHYTLLMALRKLASRLNTSVTLDSATQRQMRDEINAALWEAEGTDEKRSALDYSEIHDSGVS